MVSTYHPAEYGNMTLKELLNCYNSIIFFDLNTDSKGNWISRHFRIALQLYKNVIDKRMDRIQNIKLSGKDYYVLLDDNNVVYANKYFGFPITSYSLNNALHYGGLFIRKVLNVSNIEKYSDTLFSIDQYVLNMDLSGKSLRKNLSDTIKIQKIDGSMIGGNNEYHNKFQKYLTKIQDNIAPYIKPKYIS